MEARHTAGKQQSPGFHLAISHRTLLTVHVGRQNLVKVWPLPASLPAHTNSAQIWGPSCYWLFSSARTMPLQSTCLVHVAGLQPQPCCVCSLNVWMLLQPIYLQAHASHDCLAHEGTVLTCLGECGWGCSVLPRILARLLLLLCMSSHGRSDQRILQQTATNPQCHQDFYSSLIACLR